MADVPTSSAPDAGAAAAPPESGQRRRLTAEHRRAAIVDAARCLFARNGFHGTGTADIAARAGCSEPTLYKHFPSKHDLFAAVLVEAAAAMRERVEAVEADGDEDDPIGVVARFSRELVGDPWFIEKVRLRTLASSLCDEPEIRDVVAESVGCFRARVFRAVEESQERGTVRADVDPDAAAWLWVGMSFVAGFRQAVEGDEGLADMPQITETLLRLLRPQPEEGTP